MAITPRPLLVAITAAAVIAGGVAVPPDGHPAEAQSPPTTVACVDLTAAAQPLSQPDLTTLAAMTPSQVLDAGQILGAVVAPTLVTTPGLINLANFIDNAYNAIEPWVRYAVSLAAYAVSWIPYIGWIIDDQIWVVYNFVESLINSGVFNVTDWLRGEGSFAKNLADWVVDLGLALVWLGIDEIGAWIPLPPLNYPPRPPWADLPEGVFGDTIVDASELLARVSNGIWDVWEPIKGGIDNGVGWLTGVLDRFERVPFVPLINFEINATWQLIAAGGDALTGFAHDMINAGNQFVIDTIDGGGLIAATVAAFDTTLASIAARGGEAVQAFVDWGRAQVDFLVDLVTPGSAQVVAPDEELATVAAPEPSHVAVEVVAPQKETSLRTARTAEVTSGDPVEGGQESDEATPETVEVQVPEVEPVGDEAPEDRTDEDATDEETTDLSTVDEDAEESETPGREAPDADAPDADIAEKDTDTDASDRADMKPSDTPADKPADKPSENSAAA